MHIFRILMADESLANVIEEPLAKLVLEREKILSFFYLPKRKLKYQYSEITSANWDTSYPLAPDFTFHIRYGKPINNAMLSSPEYVHSQIIKLAL